MAHQDVSPDTPSHTPGVRRGEEQSHRSHTARGVVDCTRTARDSTSINPRLHGPIDSRMPQIPPA